MKKREAAEKKKEKLGLARFSSVIIALITAAGIAVYVCLPSLVGFYVDHAHIEGMRVSSKEAIMALLYTAGVPVLALLVLSFLMTLNISRGKAFVRVNVVYLNLISLLAVFIAAAFAVGYFFMNSVFPIIIAVMFLLLAVLTKVFADLFKTAIVYKQENELTI